MPRSERPNMASYGVPEELDGVLDWSWAEERLVANRNFWVTTVDQANRPHSMPVWGLWHAASERFWFGCADDSLKARNLATNPHVVVATADTVEVVSIEGTAQRQPANAEIAKALGRKYESDPAKQEQLAGFMMEQDMFEITPVKAFGLIEREELFSTSATRWVF